MKNYINPLQSSYYEREKKAIIDSLEEFKHSTIEYSLTRKKNTSPFATIFSIFIKDLLNYQFTDEERFALRDYLNSFQNKNTGLFSNDKCTNNKNFYCKSCLQLTTFSLSALSILNFEPVHKINHAMKDKDDIYEYLDKVGVKNGKLGSGNFAMFLGIFLSHEKILDEKNNLINHWFDYHNKYFNIKNGVWTSGIRSKSQWSYQNALHQFIIYEYWEESPPDYKKTVDVILDNADKNATFALLPGGGACCDYDAVHLLNFLGINNGYRVEEIKNLLKKTYNQILNTKDKIGFCENNFANKLSFPRDLNLFHNNNILSTIFRIREFIAVKDNSFLHYPHWSKFPIKIYESDLWSIWFRLITIAEIENIFLGKDKWKFHNFPGLGILKT